MEGRKDRLSCFGVMMLVMVTMSREHSVKQAAFTMMSMEVFGAF